MGKTRKQAIGVWGEEQASLFLLAAGYRIVERNFSIRLGEIDIIAEHEKPHHGRTLCFIEVKTRSAVDGSAERATGQQKLQHLFSAARAYCLSRYIPMERTPIQFEQVSVYRRPDGSARCAHYIIPVQ